jgi:hypothetical protein
MQTSDHVFCPYCGQQFELVIDLSAGPQTFTTDCEVCCRPFDVEVRIRAGELAGLEVHG